MTLEKRIFLLKTASVLTGLFALFFFLALFTPVSVIFDWLTSILANDSAATASGNQAAKLYVAVSAGLIAGVATIAWKIAVEVMPGDPALARRLFMPLVWVWFVIDSVGCLIIGAFPNVLLNIVFLGVFALPFWKLKSV